MYSLVLKCSIMCAHGTYKCTSRTKIPIFVLNPVHHWESLANLRVTINLNEAVYEHVYLDWGKKKER